MPTYLPRLEVPIGSESYSTRKHCFFSLFITVSINHKFKFLQKPGMDTERSSSFFQLHENLRIFDKPDNIARLYNIFEDEFIKDRASSSKEYFGFKFVRVASKLQIQSRVAANHHGSLFSKVMGLKMWRQPTTYFHLSFQKMVSARTSMSWSESQHPAALSSVQSSDWKWPLSLWI